MPDTPDDSDPEGHVVGDDGSAAEATAGYGQRVEHLCRVIGERVHEFAPAGEEANSKHLLADGRRRDLRRLAEGACDAEWPQLARPERDKVIEEALDQVLGYGPLEVLLKDPTVYEIMVNGPRMVYVERRGRLEKSDARFRDESHLLSVIHRLADRIGRCVNTASPYLDAALPDGSRLNVVLPPVAVDGPSLTIRRFGATPLKLEDLLNYRVFSPEMAMVMEACILGRLNVLISGGTGSGKTTVLNTLSGFIPEAERVVTIEEVAEMQLQHEHVVRLVAVTGVERSHGLRDLIPRAFRLRPDRIVFGEIRGPESLDILLAMTAGQNGWLTTHHANSPMDAMNRLETLVQLAVPGMPRESIHRQLAAAVNVVVQINRLQGGPRKVTSISEVIGTGDTFELRELFRYRQLGVDQNGRAFGQFETTGVRPTFVGLLEARGIKLPSNMFAERILLRD